MAASACATGGTTRLARIGRIGLARIGRIGRADHAPATPTGHTLAAPTGTGKRTDTPIASRTSRHDAQAPRLASATGATAADATAAGATAAGATAATTGMMVVAMSDGATVVVGSAMTSVAAATAETRGVNASSGAITAGMTETADRHGRTATGIDGAELRAKAHVGATAALSSATLVHDQVVVHDHVKPSHVKSELVTSSQVKSGRSDLTLVHDAVGFDWLCDEVKSSERALDWTFVHDAVSFDWRRARGQGVWESRSVCAASRRPTLTW